MMKTLLSKREGGSMGKNYRILIIDDSKETVEGLGSFFRDKYDVLTAYNGLDGIKEFDRSDGCVDLVLTDLVMPDISGIGVISVIKKKSPELPIIAMTGWGEHPGALARDAKADLVMNKPFELEDLDRSVTELLARKS
jgi:DNA-binding response OmpR family regulator